MANILFKRGQHSNLPSSADVIDGAFYLTEDTHRLFAGIGSELVDLNQYIQVVETTDDLLNLSNLELGDFAYIKNGNILAIYREFEGKVTWKQINPNTDTQLKSISFGNKDSLGVAKSTQFSLSIEDDDGNVYHDCIEIIGTDGVRAEVAADGSITIAGCTYQLKGTLEGPADAQQYTLTLKGSNTELTDSNFILQEGSLIDFTANGTNTLKISAADQSLKKGTFTTGTNGSATVSFENELGKTVSAEVKEGFYYEVGGAKVYNKAALNVYTKDEVDSKFRTLNPMAYKGVVSSVSDLTGKTNVQAGDTYMSNLSFGISAITGNAEQTCAIGDLFIATGTEDSTTGFITNVTWTYVPSGDNAVADTQYKGQCSAGSNILNLVDDNENPVHRIEFTEGNSGRIDISSEAITIGTNTSAGLKVSINHNTPGAEDTKKKKTVTTELQGFKFNAISNVLVDATGHVKEFTSQAYAIPEYELKNPATVSVANNIATIKTILADDLGNETFASFNIDTSAQDSLSVTASGSSVKLSLEWGTF